MAILGGSSVPLLISIVIFEKIDNEKRKIEIKWKNIPGGVAYSQENSKFGFFNNPLR